MLDNQTRMREMLNLIESVDQSKKTKLNEGLGGSLTGGAIGSLEEVIPGFKNSRPIRVIVDGVGIDTTVGELGKIYSPEVLSQVARDIPPIHAGRTSILVHLLQQYDTIMGSRLNEDSGFDSRQLAQEALSAAVRYIQDELNVSEEDEEIAYEYFSDYYTDEILDMFVEFIEHQVDAQNNGDAPPNDDF